jgi:hypothetical protein
LTGFESGPAPHLSRIDAHSRDADPVITPTSEPVSREVLDALVRFWRSNLANLVRLAVDAREALARDDLDGARASLAAVAEGSVAPDGDSQGHPV